MTNLSDDAWIFDFDNHYYEAEDAFTRYHDRALRNRGVRWADIDGRRRLLVGGTINSYIANPTLRPGRQAGALYDWYRGNPRAADDRGGVRRARADAAGVPRPRRAAEGHGRAGPRRHAAVPDARRRHRGRAEATTPRPRAKVFARLQPLARRGLGLRATRAASSPSPTSRCSIRRRPRPSCDACSTQGAVVVNVRSGPVPGPGRSPVAVRPGLRRVLGPRRRVRRGRRHPRRHRRLRRRSCRCGSRAGARARCSARRCGASSPRAGR